MWSLYALLIFSISKNGGFVEESIFTMKLSKNPRRPSKPATEILSEKPAIVSTCAEPISIFTLWK